eukprot:COSAG06_NODE_1618_length_8914_cov_10.299830_10_plen_77_part_00
MIYGLSLPRQAQDGHHHTQGSQSVGFSFDVQQGHALVTSSNSADYDKEDLGAENAYLLRNSITNHDRFIKTGSGQT